MMEERSDNLNRDPGFSFPPQEPLAARLSAGLDGPGHLEGPVGEICAALAVGRTSVGCATSQEWKSARKATTLSIWRVDSRRLDFGAVFIER